MKKLRLLGILLCLFAVSHTMAQVTTLDCDGIASFITEQAFSGATEQEALAAADMRLADLQSIYPGWTVFYVSSEPVGQPGLIFINVKFFRCLEGAAYPGIDHYKTASPITSSITPLLDLGYQISRVDNFKDGRTRIHLSDALGQSFVITVDKTGALAGITQELE